MHSDRNSICGDVVLGSFNKTSRDEETLKKKYIKAKCSDYSYNDFSDEQNSINTYEFWNASLSYRKDEDSKFEYELKATNLLNTRSQNQSNASNISVSATEYFIQPRYLTFRVRYEL